MLLSHLSSQQISRIVSLCMCCLHARQTGLVITQKLSGTHQASCLVLFPMGINCPHDCSLTSKPSSSMKGPHQNLVICVIRCDLTHLKMPEHFSVTSFSPTNISEVKRKSMSLTFPAPVHVLI